MTDPTMNDNQRKDVDRWDDEGGRPRSPERSPRPDPVESLPSLPPIAVHAQEDVAPPTPRRRRRSSWSTRLKEQSPKTWASAILIREVCERKIRTKT